MGLKQLFERFAPSEEITALIAYRDGFKARVAFWGEQRLKDAARKSRKITWEGHQRKEGYDDEKFREHLARAVVDWEGLTPRVLAAMGVLDLRKVPAAERDQPVPHSPEDALWLMGQSLSFSDFVAAAVGDPSLFPLAEEEKNSSASSGGPASPDA